MKNNKERQSNIEILRIIAILLVILSHFNVHGKYEIVNMYSVNINYLLKNIFTTGCFANSIFIIIMGYFAVKKNINYKKIIKLAIDMIFYSCLIAIVLRFLGIIELNKFNIIKIIFPMIYGNWFCAYYIVFYFFTPTINFILNKMDKKNLEKYLIFLFLFCTIMTTITSNTYMLSNFSAFILLYIIGGYISLYYDRELNVKKLLLITILTYTISFSTVITMYMLGIFFKKANLILNCNSFIAGNMSFFVIIPAIFTFLVFKNLKFKNNKYINYIAKSVLGIYLIHDNSFIRQLLWNRIIPNNTFFNNNFFFAFAILKVITVFLVCLIIDKLKIIICDRTIIKISEKIEMILRRIYSKIKRIISILFKELYI